MQLMGVPDFHSILGTRIFISIWQLNDPGVKRYVEAPCYAGRGKLLCRLAKCQPYFKVRCF